MRQHRGERCRRTRRLARQQGVHRQTPAQTQRPSAQGANARNQHTHSTGAHNANMRNSIVGIWAHRARSRRAQSHKAQSHKVRSRRAWPHRRRHTGREGGRRRRSRASAFTIEVGPTTKLHEHTEDTARAGKRAQGGHVHRWRDVRAQRKHARGAHRPQACARTRTTHCCRVLGAALELASPPAAAHDAHPT